MGPENYQDAKNSVRAEKKIAEKLNGSSGSAFISKQGADMYALQLYK